MHLLRNICTAGVLSALFMSSAFAQAVVGKPAPDFSLKDSRGNMRTLSEFAGKTVVLEWFNPECPFVKKHYKPGAMQASQKKVTDSGAIWLTISSSAEGKQGHLTLDDAARVESELQINSSGLLLDTDGKTGQAYGAKTTPHMFVVGPDGNISYAGAIDDVASADSDDIAKSKNYVLAAVEAIKKGETPDPASTTPYGCSVKYKS